jgi:hypothetical protein
MILDGLSAGVGPVYMRENEVLAMLKATPQFQSK